MRWFPTIESVHAREVSVLAIIETMAAMFFSLWIAGHLGTTTHIVIASVITPIMLLRTDHSCAIAVSWSTVVLKATERDYVPLWEPGLPDDLSWSQCVRRLANSWIRILGWVLLVPIRAAATAVGFFLHPIVSLRAVSNNWRDIVFSVGMSSSPWLVPFPRDVLDRAPGTPIPKGWLLYPWIAGTMRSIGRRHARFSRMLVAIANLLIFAVVLGPPLAYRWSLKSTAIVWCPLLWALRPVQPRKLAFKARLRLIEGSDVFRVILGVSAVVVVMFVAKLWFLTTSSALYSRWNGTNAGRFLAFAVQPELIPPWQVATFINSILTIAVWLFVRSCVRHIDEGVPRSEQFIERVLSSALVMRRFLTCYTMPCVFYLWVCDATTWNLPKLGDKLVPWL